MARAKLAPFLSALQGKLGPVTFTKGVKGQTNMRTRTAPANPRTPAQLAVRAAQTKSAQIFKNFPPATVAAWQAYAATLPQVSKKTGAKIVVQGINAYCGLADKLLQMSATSTPPTTPPTGAFTGDSLAITVAATTGQVTWTSTSPNSANVATELLLQPLKSKNRKPTIKGYKSRAFAKFVAGGLSYTVAVPTGYYAAAYRYVNIVTGQETALVPLGTQTVALSLEDGGLADGEAMAPTVAPKPRAARAKKAA